MKKAHFTSDKNQWILVTHLTKYYKTIALVILLMPFTCKAQQPVIFSEYTVDILQFVEKWLPKNPIVLEAGSYDGQDTVLMAKKWPEGKIFTFEPIEQLFIQAKQNTFAYPNVQCFQKALSDKSGKALFYISQINGNISASSSLLPPKQHLDFYPDITFDSSITVETILLDEWAQTQNLDHVDFLWLDMQGFELPMLKQSKIAQAATAIYIEVEFIEAYEGQFLYEDICEWMESQGFCLVAKDFTEALIKNKRFWGNCLFVKRLKIDTLDRQ
jgi:FkbM family methyltransferase